MIFNREKFKIKNRENPQNILNFQEETGYILPPSYLYILFNYGAIKYDYHNQHLFSGMDGKYYNGILIDQIPNIDSLKMWLKNRWSEVLKNNVNINNCYVPMIGTYAPNIGFLVGIVESNLDKIYLYDDDYEYFKPILVANDIFEFFTHKVTSNYV